MRALVQRVKNASVSVGGSVSGEIQGGMLIFLGVTHTDTSDDAAYLARRCSSLRIFEDPDQKMNLALPETGGSALVVSQFTLYADTRKGHRPSFVDAARPEVAEALYNEFVGAMRAELGAARVKTGVFKAMMEIRLVNDGPVTIMLESKNHTS